MHTARMAVKFNFNEVKFNLSLISIILQVSTNKYMK